MDDTSVRLWNLTEEDSGPDISAPEIVKFLRETLSENRLFSWDDLYLQGKEIGFSVEFLTPEDPAFALWALAAIWARHVFPGRAAKRYLEYGAVVAAFALDDGFGPLNARQRKAYESIRSLSGQQRAANWNMRVRVSDMCMQVAHLIL